MVEHHCQKTALDQSADVPTPLALPLNPLFTRTSTIVPAHAPARNCERVLCEEVVTH